MAVIAQYIWPSVHAVWPVRWWIAAGRAAVVLGGLAMFAPISWFGMLLPYQ